jgi:chromosome segregation ATPase
MSNQREQLETKLGTLERKLRLLLTEHTKVKNQLSSLQAENAELKQNLQAKDQQLDGFKNRSNINNIVTTITAEEGDSTELKQKLSDYIKKIDVCIAQLAD